MVGGICLPVADTSTLRNLPFPGVLGGGSGVDFISSSDIQHLLYQSWYNISMKLEDKIREILFNIGKEIKIHTVGKDMIIEIDYDKYVEELIECYNIHNDKDLSN